jgi:copper chaperone CopZ
MRQLTFILVLFGLFLAAPSVGAQMLYTEATQDVRNEAAVKKLKANPKAVLVYAQGLCCPSCSIGVRKKVGVLPFVDQKRFEGGIVLDAETQLVTIALKDGAKIDMVALSKAVDDAGYPPVHLYTLNKGKLDTQKLSVN